MRQSIIRSVLYTALFGIIFAMFTPVAASAEEGPSSTDPVVPAGVALPARVGTPAELAGSSCGGTAFTSWSGGWGPESSGGCGIAGYPGYRVPYNWSQSSNVSVCTNGFGYIGASEVWRYTGCGWISGGYVPWGNVLAVPKMRASGVPPYVIPVPWYNYS